MALYKPRQSSKTWWYEFTIGGRRVREDSGATNKREAMAAETDARAAARRQAAEQAEIARRFKGGEITFADARDRFMLEHGQFLAKANEYQRGLDWVGLKFGEDRLLSEMDNAEIRRLVGLKRSEASQAGANRNKGTTPKYAEPKKLSSATVNRDLVVPLRQITRMARQLWNCAAPDIQWKLHMLKERGEIKREATPAEEEALLSELDRGYGVAIEFGLLSGCRLAEIVTLDWSKVNFFAGELYITGKGDKTRTLPMTRKIRELLEAQRGLHPVYVFTYEAARTRKADGLVRGRRYPITYSGLTSRWRRGTASAGVVGLRIHDTRHTAATRTLRAGKNLRAVKEMLGHASIATTLKYAHVLTDDIRTAMEAAELAADTRAMQQAQAAAKSPQQSPQQRPKKSRKYLKQLAKSA